MSRLRAIGRSAAYLLACMALPAALLVSGHARAVQRYEACVDRRNFHDTLTAVINESFKPGPQGNAIDQLVIPPDTPPSVIAILAQLTTDANPPDPAEVARFIRLLGARPSCTEPGVL